jgi:hypothetical protein
MTVYSLRGAAPLEFGNGRVERFHLRLVVVVPLLGKPDYPHQCARGRRIKAVAVIPFTPASTTSVTLLALYVQNTSPLLLL